MEQEITTNHLRILAKLDSFITEKNLADIHKIKRKCEAVYNDVIKYVQNGSVKKTHVDCFNWYEIFIKIFENEKDVVLSKTIYDAKKYKKEEGRLSKNSKEYIVTNSGKRIYKIISKPIDYINKTIDCDYDPNYCILDIIQDFSDDAISREHFLYREEFSELCMIFIDKPCDELIEEIKNKNIIPVSVHDLPLKFVKETDTINIDINIIISLCSDINDLKPDSALISKIISNQTFVGFDIDVTKKFTNEEFCEYVKKEREKITNIIQQYKRAIMCQSAYNDITRILFSNGTESEKNKLDVIIKNLNVEIIDDTKYSCDLIDNNSKNLDRIYNKVERDVAKISYLFNAMTLTSNHRYFEFLSSKNIFVQSIMIPSLNLICKTK